MQLSIIIPVYNTSKYLKKCLDSVLEQNLDSKDYEVLIVNDGSIDNSLDIILQYTTVNSNFHIFNKKNGGLSSARNLGIDNAKGIYIYFMDSDDFLSPNTLNKILSNALTKDVDCASFRFTKIDESGRVLSISPSYEAVNIMSGSEYINKYTIVSNVWRYIFKTEIIKNNDIRFINGIYHEDEAFMIIFLSFCKSVLHDELLVYNYLMRSNSIITSTSTEHRLKMLNDIIVVIESACKRRDETSNELRKGISKKIEQLSVSVFFKMKKNKMKFEEISPIILKLEEMKLYPLKINYNNLKFKLSAKLFNNKFFCKYFYR